METHPLPPDDYVIIFVAYVTLKNGKRLYARALGKKAIPIRVKRKAVT